MVLSVNESEKELFNLVFEQLMNLPAYKLNNRYQNIFREYAYRQFNKSIKSKTLEDYFKINEDREVIFESIDGIYQRPNSWKTFCFSFNSLSNRDKVIGCIAMMFFAFSFLVKASNHWLILFGIIFLLLFIAFYFSYGILLTIRYFQVDSTFSIINSISKDIQESIIYFRYLNEDNLHDKAKIIIINIIKDEKARIENIWKKIPIFHVFFASFICLMFVYIVGDTFLEEIKWIASILGFKDFKLIQELNLEKFTIGFLFPIGLLLSRFAVNSGLDKRRKKISASLEGIKESIN